MKRARITLIEGKTYLLKDRLCRTYFRCIGYENGDPVVINVKSKWICTVHGAGMYEDGMIDWDYSTNGHFGK